MKKRVLKNFTKLINYVKEFARSIRLYIKKLRKKNMSLYDSLSKVAEVVWFVGTNIFVGLAHSTLFDIIVIFIAFLCIYFYQWALLSNKCEEKLELQNDEHEAQSESLKKECEEKIESLVKLNHETAKFSHCVSHNIKENTSKSSFQEVGVIGNDLVDLLSDSMNSLEDLLTSHYGHNVCASVKLCSKRGYLKTYARGEKMY